MIEIKKNIIQIIAVIFEYFFKFKYIKKLEIILKNQIQNVNKKSTLNHTICKILVINHKNGG